MKETLDGSPFELTEPAEHEVLSRDEYKLPEEGVLSVQYVSSARAPTMADVVSAAVFFELVTRAVSDRFSKPCFCFDFAFAFEISFRLSRVSGYELTLCRRPSHPN